MAHALAFSRLSFLSSRFVFLFGVVVDIVFATGGVFGGFFLLLFLIVNFFSCCLDWLSGNVPLVLALCFLLQCRYEN